MKGARTERWVSEEGDKEEEGELRDRCQGKGRRKRINRKLRVRKMENKEKNDRSR